jgi:hypothetical protein
MDTLSSESNNPTKVLRLLIETVKITSRDGERPEVVVCGVRYRNYDLLKVARLLPNEELQPEDRALVDAIFDKRQKTYSMTGHNLAHRANSIAADASMRRVLRDPSMMASGSASTGDAEVRFAERGFSKRTVKALMDGGIDTPERLLFLEDAVIKECPGIGRASLEEVKAYRTKFGARE